ncbi:MAG: hypothetical protein K8I30_16280 [Anaerolineae bacterium]|nr:hypothetical protein [Anaerolineae bacterium]
MELAPLLLSFGSIALFFLIMVLLILRAVRIQKALEARLAEIAAREGPILTLKSWGYRAQVGTVNGIASKAEACMILLTASDIILYDRTLKVNELFRCKAGEIRWFGRPQKYSDGDNEIWLHLEREGAWQLLKIRLPRGAMQDFVRAIKTLVQPELVTAYRRARPYIHAGPVKAQPAAQDIHGAWTLDAPVDIYLMPRFLVVLSRDKVLRKVPLEAVQQIGALKRLDQPEAQGLVRFRAEDEPFAFAVNKHEEFAALLAEAAKRTLEVPLERKQKNKLDDEDDDPEYEYDGTFEYDANFDA